MLPEQCECAVFQIKGAQFDSSRRVGLDLDVQLSLCGTTVAATVAVDLIGYTKVSINHHGD